MNERVELGRTGLKVSPVCFGTWQLSPRFWGPQDENSLIQAMRRAFEIGVNFYDTADAYGDGLAERVLGKALAELPRARVIVATKVYWHFYGDGRRHPDLSGQYVLAECDASLKRLRMDHVDLYQLHSWDPITPVGETVAALEKLVKAGKVRAYGASNWNCEQMRLGAAAGGKFATLQPPYSLINRGIEKDVLPYCQANQIGTLVYSPLHKGLLTGKYKGNETFEDLRQGNPDFTGERFRRICDAVAKVGEIARDYKLSTVQLVLAVTLMHPAITVAIAGVKNAAHIEDSAGAMGKTVSFEDAHRVRDLLRF